MKLSSPAFPNAGPIPPEFTCDGEDRSPPLEWTEVPEGTKSFALVLDDPDAPAGLWTHWVLWDIPPDTRSLPSASAPGGLPGIHGANSWGNARYQGPCPPPGTHRYRFQLFALDRRLGLRPGSSPAHLKKALGEHVLGEARLQGTYRRATVESTR